MEQGGEKRKVSERGQKMGRVKKKRRLRSRDHLGGRMEQNISLNFIGISIISFSKAPFILSLCPKEKKFLLLKDCCTHIPLSLFLSLSLSPSLCLFVSVFFFFFLFLPSFFSLSLSRSLNRLITFPLPFQQQLKVQPSDSEDLTGAAFFSLILLE